MSDQLIFLPVFVQICLILSLYLILLQRKRVAVKNRDFDKERVKLHDDGWPEPVEKVNKNITNQFQIPMLFFVLVGVLWMLGAVTVFEQVIAWLFVVSRLVHSYIHTGSNYVPWRAFAFAFGVLMVLILLISATISVFVGL